MLQGGWSIEETTKRRLNEIHSDINTKCMDLESETACRIVLCNKSFVNEQKHCASCRKEK